MDKKSLKRIMLFEKALQRSPKLTIISDNWLRPPSGSRQSHADFTDGADFVPLELPSGW